MNRCKTILTGIIFPQTCCSQRPAASLTLSRERQTYLRHGHLPIFEGQVSELFDEDNDALLNPRMSQTEADPPNMDVDMEPAVADNIDACKEDVPAPKTGPGDQNQLSTSTAARQGDDNPPFSPNADNENEPSKRDDRQPGN